MNDLRQAAEMALEFVSWFAGEDHSVRPKHKAPEIAEALRQALRQALAPEVTPEVPCKTHPDAPHGFDRNASHSADRYVCECEGWEPVDKAYTKNDTTAGVLHKENT